MSYRFGVSDVTARYLEFASSYECDGISARFEPHVLNSGTTRGYWGTCPHGSLHDRFSASSKLSQKILGSSREERFLDL